MGLMDFIRNFADKSGGHWISENRHSTWIDLGDLKIKKQYPKVSYSKESCFQLGNEGAVCILRSADFSKLRNYYFSVRVDLKQNYLRVMRIREENMHDKFIDEIIFTVEECFDIPFVDCLLNANQAEQIFKLGVDAGIANSDSWFYKM